MALHQSLEGKTSVRELSKGSEPVADQDLRDAFAAEIARRRAARAKGAALRRDIILQDELRRLVLAWQTADILAAEIRARLDGGAAIEDGDYLAVIDGERIETGEVNFPRQGISVGLPGTWEKA